MRSIGVPERYASDPLPVQIKPTQWADGTVIRFRSRLAPGHLAAAMQHALAKFDAWAIVTSMGECVESAEISTVSQFFGNHKTFSQIYIIAPNNDGQYQMAAEGIMSKLTGAPLPAFHFRDGKIILVATDEPSRITACRCRSYLEKMSYWAIVDHDGGTSFPDMDNEWTDAYLDSLSYEYET